ncbi:MAG: septum formation initiator family protein, partial [Gammaproteobacteria bacterium]|nr:septum formation initiator family protein [Gammaproteobacteria bacterium]
MVRSLIRWLVLIALIVCFVFLQREIWSTDSGLPYGWQLDKKIAAQKEANAGLERNNARRRVELKALKSGGAAIEEHARTDLGWVKKGETFYRIVHAPAGASAANAASVAVP